MGPGFGEELGRALFYFFALCIIVAFGLGFFVRGCHLPFTIEMKRSGAAHAGDQ